MKPKYLYFSLAMALLTIPVSVSLESNRNLGSVLAAPYPEVSNPELNQPICFLETTDGQTLDLSRLCGVSESNPPSPNLLRLTQTRQCSGCALSGSNLSGQNLTNVNLVGADLRGADLRNADLRNANLFGANLTGTDLSGANLTGANLQQTKMNGTNFSDAILPDGSIYN